MTERPGSALALALLLLLAQAGLATACGARPDTQGASIVGRVVTRSESSGDALLTLPVADARVLVAEMASGEPVAETVSNSQGRFTVPVPPGRYVVRVVARNGVKAWSPVIATVHSHQATRVVLEVKTR